MHITFRSLHDGSSCCTARRCVKWISAYAKGVHLDFIDPGKPTRNGLLESFNGKFRDECLNGHWFRDLVEARRLIEAWRVDYNEERPHSALGNLPPRVFAAQMAQREALSL